MAQELCFLPTWSALGITVSVEGQQAGTEEQQGGSSDATFWGAPQSALLPVRASLCAVHNHAINTTEVSRGTALLMWAPATDCLPWR